jgi:hypothetical protein
MGITFPVLSRFFSGSDICQFRLCGKALSLCDALFYDSIAPLGRVEKRSAWVRLLGVPVP